MVGCEAAFDSGGSAAWRLGWGLQGCGLEGAWFRGGRVWREGICDSVLMDLRVLVFSLSKPNSSD